MTQHSSYHIQNFGPTDSWPKGGWSVYRITGDEIAQHVVIKGGKVTERHSWSGYLGIAENLEGVQTIIAQDMAIARATGVA